MKVRNYLVLKNYNIVDQFFLYTDMDLVKSRYARMQELVVESAGLYLQDLDQIIIDTLTVGNDQQMFKHHMELLRQRHTSEPCNILYCDLDMVFVKPYEIFNKLDTFSMCTGNCGVRYYPYNGMTDELWNIQTEMSKSWETRFTNYHDHVRKWDYEQQIYNVMLEYARHDQVLAGQTANPFMPYIHNVYNYPYNGAGLIHCCGTSRQFDSVALMQELLGLSKMNKYEDIRELLERDLYAKFSGNPENTHLYSRDNDPWILPQDK